MKIIKIAVEEMLDNMCDADWHTCPYKEEIHGDYESLCDCDADCAQDCMNNI